VRIRAHRRCIAVALIIFGSRPDVGRPRCEPPTRSSATRPPRPPSPPRPRRRARRAGGRRRAGHGPRGSRAPRRRWSGRPRPENRSPERAARSAGPAPRCLASNPFSVAVELVLLFAVGMMPRFHRPPTSKWPITVFWKMDGRIPFERLLSTPAADAFPISSLRPGRAVSGRLPRWQAIGDLDPMIAFHAHGICAGAIEVMLAPPRSTSRYSL
jgi:hypothetical protein